jgi:hypothetical protein
MRAIILYIWVVFWSLVESIFYPPTYLNVPFSAQVARSSIYATIEVPAKEYYGFYFNLHFREHDQADRARVSILAGVSHLDISGNLVNTGVAIPVLLKVSKNGDDKIIICKAYMEENLEGFGSDSFSKIITGAFLEPGSYNVSIEAMENIEELKNVPIYFTIKRVSK